MARRQSRRLVILFTLAVLAMVAAVDVVLMLAFGGTYYLHQQQQRRAGDAHAEQAVREVVLALQVASDAVSAAQAKVEEITRYEPTNNY